MKWPEEERDAAEYPGQYRRAADAFVARYLTASWRKAAVASVRRVVQTCLKEAKSAYGSLRAPGPEALREALDADGIPEAADELLRDDGHNGVSLAAALLADAAGVLFCNSPSVPRWQMVGQIIENDPVAYRVLVDLVEHRLSRRPSLREDVRQIARRLVRQSVQDPGDSAYRGDQATFTEMHRLWTAKPDLHEIWFGHAVGKHVMLHRSDWQLFDLLFEVDTAFAAELIEAYEAPYQPALILQWGSLNPNRRFADWMRLMEVALPAFEADGTWNGRVLLPLLLNAAEDALRGWPELHADDENAAQLLDAPLAKLLQAIASAILARQDGAAAALRWSGWLFRRVMSQLDSERIPYPDDSNSRARPAWLAIEALVETPSSVGWLDLRPMDVPAEDELCLEAARSLAARQHDRTVPGRDLLFEMLPDKPEEFLEGETGRRMRELPSLFVIWGKRADAFGTRVLAATLFAGDVASTFSDLWRRTLVLREIAEHGHAFRSDEGGYDDRTARASQTIRFVIALGINLLDYVQDPRQPAPIENCRAATLALFATLHDATREMLAIDPIGRRDMESVHDHLCVRRFFYEATHVSDNPVAAPLDEAEQPTAGDLLVERCAVDRAFFETLQMLRANGIKRERIARALEGTGVRLDRLVEQAQRLNAIEHVRTIDLTGLKSGGSA